MRRAQHARLRPALRLSIAVDDHVGDEGQQAAGAVAALRRVEQIRRCVDEAGGVAAVAEFRMLEHSLEEREVGGDPGDAEFAQGAVEAQDRLLGGGRPGGYLLQERVVVARHQRAGISGAAVKADAETVGAAIGGQAAIVGDEIVVGILGGDAALDGVAVEAHVFLLGHARFRRADARALGDVDLCLDDIDAGDDFGYRVLDLDARIDLDEIGFAGVDIVEELGGSGIAIADLAREAQRRFTQFGALPGVELRRRGAFDHLLIAALHRTVALEQVDQVAVRVAEQLDLDMAGAFNQLFEIDLVVAEGGLGLAPRRLHQIGHLLGGADGAHAAPAAAPARLQHHREADAPGFRQRRGRIGGERTGGRHHRHGGRLGQRARFHLVAEGAHHIGRGADEGDAGLGAGFGEIGILGQETIARVNRVALRMPGDADDGGYVEIGLDRTLVLPQKVAFVCLESVQRVAVLARIDRHRGDAQLSRGAEHADGDLAAVGHQQLVDFARGRTRG